MLILIIYFWFGVCGCSFVNGQNILNIFADRVKLLIDKHMAIQKPWLLDISGFRMSSIKIFTVKNICTLNLKIPYTQTQESFEYEKNLLRDSDG
jgi:hypothetical protein